MHGLLGVYAIIVVGLTAAEYRRRSNLQKTLKPLAALLFIAIALAGGAIYWDYGRWILYGLIACALGDVLLLSRDNPTRFKFGMAAFAAGHLLYLFAFTKIATGAQVHPLALIAILAGGTFFWWIRPRLPRDMTIPVALYSLIIIAMVVRSFGVPMIIVPIAAAMFAVSDMFVARDRFVEDDPKNALAITPLYFGAQALFALSAAI